MILTGNGGLPGVQHRQIAIQARHHLKVPTSQTSSIFLMSTNAGDNHFDTATLE